MKILIVGDDEMDAVAREETMKPRSLGQDPILISSLRREIVGVHPVIRCPCQCTVHRRD